MLYFTYKTFISLKTKFRSYLIVHHIVSRTDITNWCENIFRQVGVIMPYFFLKEYFAVYTRLSNEVLIGIQ